MPDPNIVRRTGGFWSQLGGAFLSGVEVAAGGTQVSYTLPKQTNPQVPATPQLAVNKPATPDPGKKAVSDLGSFGLIAAVAAVFLVAAVSLKKVHV
jgi:hypothetical protein